MGEELSEDQLQAQLWEYTWNYIPQSRGHMWAVPNGLQLPMPIAMKAKATGLLEGVWDLHIYWNAQFYIIETKVGNNPLSKDRIVHVKGRSKKHRGQKEWGELMCRHGAKQYVYRTFEEGRRIVDTIFAIPYDMANCEYIKALS